jgi:histidine triad (HIT) family protein
MAGLAFLPSEAVHYFSSLINSMDCIFCKISKGEISSDTIFEDEDVKVFKDIHPKAPVHLLVIPKTHIESIAQLKSDHRNLVTTMIYAAKQVAEEQHLPGYKLVFNVGREGGQIVDHLHLHILGGWQHAEERNINV